MFKKLIILFFISQFFSQLAIANIEIKARTAILQDFLSGAADQVNYTYQKLGGDILDIELSDGNIYAAYEEAVLEYSYIVNLHQSKNMLSDALGDATGTFDHMGMMKSSSFSASLGPSRVELKYPRFQFSYSKKVGDGMSSVGGFGGTVRQYSASFAPKEDQQDYDLQAIIEDASSTGTDSAGNVIDFANKVGNKRVVVTRVYYKSPRAMWRFYGYYGGINMVGNMSTYGMYADDSTFELVPTWQNKMQAIMYEDAIYTRTSHYSYELVDNKLRFIKSISN